MVTLSVPLQASLVALARSLETSHHPAQHALSSALAAFHKAANDGPSPTDQWRQLRDVLRAIERDDADAGLAAEVGKLRRACERELQGLAPDDDEDGRALEQGGGQTVELVVNDPAAADVGLLEQEQQKVDHLHLDDSPADEAPPPTPTTTAQLSTAAGKEPSSTGQTTVPLGDAGFPDPSQALPPDDLLPLLHSAAAATCSHLPTALGLSDAALLTTVVLCPSIVLPPGKTLLSLLARPAGGSDTAARKRKRELDELALDSLGKRGKGLDESPLASGLRMSLEERVGVMMKAAWWDQTIDDLLAPTPSTAPMVRLVQIQAELADHARFVLAPSVLAELLPVPSGPGPGDEQGGGGDEWDPRAFAQRLERMLNALKAVCAPVRDAEVDRLMALLSGGAGGPLSGTSPSTDGPPGEPDSPTGGAAAGSPAAHEEKARQTRVVVRTVQGVLDLCELMRSDLSRAQMAALPLSALPSIVRALAHAKEREELLGRWTVEDLRVGWTKWVSKPEGAGGWLQRLVESISAPRPLSTIDPGAPPPTPDGTTVAAAAVNEDNGNRLPALLTACAPTLWFAQNLVQALVITSLLVILAPAPRAPDLAARVLGLLRADLLAPPGRAHAHLDDLARMLLPRDGGNLDEVGRQALKGRIDKVLRTEDPAWGLLVRRLADTLSAALSSSSSAAAAGLPNGPLRTGRVDRSAGGESAHEGGQRRVMVKGFDGEVLEEGVGELLGVLEAVKGWVGEGRWAEVVRD